MRLLFAIIFTCLLLGLGFLFGRDVPISAQKPIYEGIRNTAAIIFGVMGAWLAILYPNAKSELSAANDSKERDKVIDKFSKYLWPMFLATVIILMIILVQLLDPLIRKYVTNQSHITIGRGLSFALISALSFWQMISIIIAIAPLEEIKIFMKVKRNRDNAVDNFLLNVQKEKSRPNQPGNH